MRSESEWVCPSAVLLRARPPRRECRQDGSCGFEYRRKSVSGGPAQGPVCELDLDHPDHIFGKIASSAILGANARIDGFDTRNMEDLTFDFACEPVHFIDREIAPGMDEDLTEFRLHVGEEFDAVPIHCVVTLYANEQRDCAGKDLEGVANDGGQHADVQSRRARD